MTGTHEECNVWSEVLTALLVEIPIFHYSVPC